MALYTIAFVRVTALKTVPQANVSPMNWAFIKASGSNVGPPVIQDPGGADTTPNRFTAGLSDQIYTASPNTPLGTVTTFLIPVSSRLAGDSIMVDGYDEIGATNKLEFFDASMVLLATIVSGGPSFSDWQSTQPLAPAVPSAFWSTLVGTQEVV